MKQFRKIAIVALMIVVMSSFVAILAACDKVTDIKLQSGSMPQTTFVLGQELNLANGKLTVTNNGVEEEIALDSPDVKVTGYDKDRLGKQELTVEYKDIVTTYEVTVVERIVAKNYTEKYFVGEQFNKVSGSLTVTEDNGLSFNVPMKDDAVSVTFDSSAAGTVNVAVSYNSYTGSFPVEVLDIASKELNIPPVRDYQSHEEKISLSGCEIILKSAGTGANVLTRRITVTEDMISDYDLSAATVANTDVPLTQKIDVKYGGEVVGSFNINIKYSSVSLMQDCAAELASIDFSTEPVITEAQGKSALDAITRYFDMADVYKPLVSDADKTTVVRVAAIYGLNAWLAEAETYANTFELVCEEEDGKVYFDIQFTSTDFDTAKADFDRLDSASSDLLNYCGVLNNIQSEFANVVVYGDKKVSEYLKGVHSKDLYNTTLKQFDFMFDLRDILDSVPNNPSDEALKGYGETILESIAFIDANKLYDRDMYAAVSAWRGGADIVDMLSNYCYLTDDATNYNRVANIYFPEEFLNLFLSIYVASIEMEALEFSFEAMLMDSLEYDTSMFIWYYKNIVATANGLKEAGGITAWIYDNLEIYTGTKFSDFIVELSDGYTSVFSPMYDLADCEEIWDKYLAVIDRVIETEVYDNELIEDMLVSLLALPDQHIFGFLASVNNLYMLMGTPSYSMNISTEESYTVFTDLLQIYAKGIKDDKGNFTTPAALPESMVDLLDLLLKSIEDCVRRFTMADMGFALPYTEDFLENMAETEKLYNSLSADQTKAADMAKFNQLFGATYQRYLAIYKQYNEDGNIEDRYEDLGEWEPVFNEIKDMTNDIRVISIMIKMAYTSGYSASDEFIVAIAKYELANSLAQSILDSGNEYIIEAYKNKMYKFEVMSEEGEIVLSIDTTLEYSLFLSRQIYAFIITWLGENFWDEYQSSEQLKGFMAQAARAIELGYKQEYQDKDMDYVATALEGYRSLSLEDRMMFLALIGLSTENDYYYGALYAYLLLNSYTVDEVVNMNCAQFTNNLFMMESSTLIFELMIENTENNVEESQKEAYKSIFDNLTASYEALTEEEKELIPDCIDEMYKYYCEKYAELTN